MDHPERHRTGRRRQGRLHHVGPGDVTDLDRLELAVAEPPAGGDENPAASGAGYEHRYGYARRTPDAVMPARAPGLNSSNDITSGRYASIARTYPEAKKGTLLMLASNTARWVRCGSMAEGARPR